MEKAKLVIEIAQKLMKVADNLRNLADSVQAVCSLIAGGLKEEPKTVIPMETVRGLLADKSRAGHTAEIREILKRHGAEKLSAFMFEIHERDGFIEEFDEKLWITTVDRVLVGQDGALTFRFKNGSEVMR